MAAAWQVGIWGHPNPRCMELQKLPWAKGEQMGLNSVAGLGYCIGFGFLPGAGAAPRDWAGPCCCAGVGWMGQVALFSLQVAHLGWLEKRTVSALFETPPTATVEDALQNFLRVWKCGNLLAKGITDLHSSQGWHWGAWIPPWCFPRASLGGRKAGERES